MVITNLFIEVDGLNYAITQWTKLLNVRYKDIYYRKRTKEEIKKYIKQKLDKEEKKEDK